MGERTEENPQGGASTDGDNVDDAKVHLTSLPTGAGNPRRDEDGRFVCPWCAQWFVSRAALHDHWLNSPECQRNRFISNQTQSKYFPAQDGVPPAPGEATLHAIRARDCEHPLEGMKPWRDQAGEVRGLQCSYCYTIIPQE